MTLGNLDQRLRILMEFDKRLQIAQGQPVGSSHGLGFRQTWSE
jgi:hypothetical protein